MVGLNLIALGRREMLALSRLEIFQARGDALGWGIAAATGLVSMFLAWVLPHEVSPAAGYVYWTLAVSMPIFGVWFSRHVRKLLAVEDGV